MLHRQRVVICIRTLARRYRANRMSMIVDSLDSGDFRGQSRVDSRMDAGFSLRHTLTRRTGECQKNQSALHSPAILRYRVQERAESQHLTTSEQWPRKRMRHAAAADVAEIPCKAKQDHTRSQHQ